MCSHSVCPRCSTVRWTRGMPQSQPGGARRVVVMLKPRREASSASCARRSAQPDRALPRSCQRTPRTRQRDLHRCARQARETQMDESTRLRDARCCELGRTDEIHDDGVIHQVVGRVVRLVVIDAERARRSGARLARAREADQPRVELCASERQRESRETKCGDAKALRVKDIRGCAPTRTLVLQRGDPLAHLSHTRALA